jgi:hypothetical protein
MKKNIDRALTYITNTGGYKIDWQIEKSFEEFQEFLAEECWDEKKYGDGKYDRKIYNWFYEKESK